MTIFNFGFQEDTLVIEGKKYKIKTNYIDLLLSFIVKKMLLNELQFGYVDIPSIELKKTYDKYWVYMKYLKKMNIIQERNHSDVHKRCKGYRFNYMFLENAEIQVVKLNNTIEKAFKHEEIPLEDQAIVPYQIVQRLKSDFESISVNLDNVERVKYEDSPYVDAPKFFRNLIQLTKLQQGGDYLKFEYKANRLYTNFSFISGFYRTRNILLNGETLVEFDLSSSFAIMFAIYALQVNPKIMNDFDFQEYCSQLKYGNFYDNMTDKLNENINANSKKLKKDKEGYTIANRRLSRSNTKELFQKLLNSKKNRQSYIKGYTNPFIKEIFEMKYGCLSNILDDMKDRNEKVYYKLAKLETEFIFSVVEEIYAKIEGIAILTLHDALYVPQTYSEKIKVIWDANIKKLYDQLPDTFIDVCDKNLEVAGIYIDNHYSPKKVKASTIYGCKYNDKYWDDFFDEDMEDF